MFRHFTSMLVFAAAFSCHAQDIIPASTSPDGTRALMSEPLQTICGVSPYLVALTSFLTKIPANPRLRLLGYDHEAYYLIKPERDRAHQRATELLNP
jgi:hypothetical protein